MIEQNKNKLKLASTGNSVPESLTWVKLQFEQMDDDQKYLQGIRQRLEEIIKTLIVQITEIQNKYIRQQKKLLKQIQQKDKLIFSLTSINNNLIKQNSRMKKKSDAQFQYFVKRITQTQNNALNEKKKMEQTILNLKAMLGNQIQYSQEDSQNNCKKKVLCTTTFGSNYRQNKYQAQAQILIENIQTQVRNHKRKYTNTELAAISQGIEIKNTNNLQGQKKKMRKLKSIQRTLSKINPETRLIEDQANFL